MQVVRRMGRCWWCVRLLILFLTGAVIVAQLLSKDKELVVSGLTSLAPFSLRLGWQIADTTRNGSYLQSMVERVLSENLFVESAEDRRLLFSAVVRLCTEFKQPSNRAKLVELRRAAAVLALRYRMAIDVCALCKGCKKRF